MLPVITSWLIRNYNMFICQCGSFVVFFFLACHSSTRPPGSPFFRTKIFARFLVHTLYWFCAGEKVHSLSSSHKCIGCHRRTIIVSTTHDIHVDARRPMCFMDSSDVVKHGDVRSRSGRRPLRFHRLASFVAAATSPGVGGDIAWRC